MSSRQKDDKGMLVFQTSIGGKTVTVEIGKYCSQSNGSCWVRCGDTVVMTNVTMSNSIRAGIDFFPLSVDFEEKQYAIGRIPGGFKRREGRASDKAILTSRLIDRPLRPLFPKGFFRDVSVVSTVLSVDTNIPPEVFGMFGSSIALSVSDIPFMGPTGSVIVGYVDGKFIINPDNEQRSKSKLHLVVSGTADAILMIEAGADQVAEKVVLEGVMFAHEEIKRQVKFIESIVKEIGKPKQQIDYYKVDSKINNDIVKYADKLLDNALNTYDRQQRQINEEQLEKNVLEHFASIYPDNTREILDVLYDMTKEKVRAKIIKDGTRPDGRKVTQIRPIWCEVSVLPRTHGSAVFTRGQTQSLTTATLGMIAEMQKLENLDEENSKRYMHQYNFPPFSTGETKPMRGPGRREIGHGALAERALEAVIPSEVEFPYCIRTVTEILSSNGSTSQASVCGSTLALMDAGVPIKSPVAGIAMGLIKEGDKVAILSDIQGVEDFLGDMDFKVAGTKQGITAIQMDIKIKGIDKLILEQALSQACQGRQHILEEMLKVLPKPRLELSKYAPKIISFEIEPDKIGDVIGKNGKVINKIIEDTGVKIDIDDKGIVYIATHDSEMAEKAKKMVLSIVEDIEVGKVYDAEVVRVIEIGAFVTIAPGKDGMIHISKLSNKRVEKVTDVVNVGDRVVVEVIKIDDRGRIDLKLKK
ncbi:MAG: polyribonucleotide nucleotidyltransferase [Clostridiales bacterium]|jgi:polyribonucleotide nucleotidyltransferase|nr:polyribonucleotide nucleotidyltransferase [Clostridiales bacterium]